MKLGSMTSVGKKIHPARQKGTKNRSFQAHFCRKDEIELPAEGHAEMQDTEQWTQGFQGMCKQEAPAHSIRQVGTRNLLECTFSSERIRNSTAVWALKTSR
jgi:hypothetical protein